jgi:hypothetical protein
MGDYAAFESLARLPATTTPPGPPFTSGGKEVFVIRAPGRCHSERSGEARGASRSGRAGGMSPLSVLHKLTATVSLAILD